MSEINFGSTYRIPITQQGINQSKKLQLKALIGSYGGLVEAGNTGYARVSMENAKDSNFLRKLKNIGYRTFQQFQGENIAKNNLDTYIKTCLDNREYKQFGKQKAKPQNKEKTIEKTSVPNESKVLPQQSERIEFVNRTPLKEQNRIRRTQGYKDIVTKYGQEIAEAIFFFERK